MDTMVKTTPEATDKPARSARMRNRLAAVFAFLAAFVSVPAAAFAQTTPTLPDASTTANDIVNNGGSQLVTVAVAVIPTVIGLLVIFWAIRFALHKLGLGGRAHV